MIKSKYSWGNSNKHISRSLQGCFKNNWFQKFHLICREWNLRVAAVEFVHILIEFSVTDYTNGAWKGCIMLNISKTKSRDSTFWISSPRRSFIGFSSVFKDFNSILLAVFSNICQVESYSIQIRDDKYFSLNLKQKWLTDLFVSCFRISRLGLSVSSDTSTGTAT